jgi:hypothetical protein
VTAPEFVLLLAWLLVPPLAIAVGALVVIHRRSPGRSVARTLGAAFFLALASSLVVFGFITSDPSSWSRALGVRDTPFMWAPFALLSVAVVFPFAAWWVWRGARA